MEKLKKRIEYIANIYKSGNLVKSETLCKEILNENPKIAFLYNLMGLIYSDLGKTDIAIKTFKEGIKIDPQFSQIYNNLGRAIFRNKNENEFALAEEYYKKSISVNNNLPEPFNNLGNLYAQLNKHDDAIKCYMKAININKNFSYAYYNLSVSFVAMGKFKEATENLKKTIELDVNFYPAHRALSRIIKYEKGSQHLKQLIKISEEIKEKKIDNKFNTSFISFSLGKAFSDIKNYDKSFNQYKLANKTLRKTFDYSIIDEEKIFNKIIKNFEKKLFDKNKNVGNESIEPIFIIGMPRSGTTLVEQIISSHPDVFGGDELNFIPNIIEKNFPNSSFELLNSLSKEKFKSMGLDYESNIKKISNNSLRFTDKLPLNFKWIGLIKLILPNAKIIHCIRNPHDVCFSIYTNYFTNDQMRFSYNMDEIIKYYNLYSNIISYWNSLFPNLVYTIKYENLINNSEMEIKSMIKYTNLKWDDIFLKHYENSRSIKTASDIQARQKIYDSSIDKWKKYSKHLDSYFNKLSL
jgi:tetratricopeptide (TPR) repeat protein